MPSDLQTFTNCAGPGMARSHRKLGGLAQVFLDFWYAVGPVGKVITGVSFFAVIAATIFGLAAVFPPGWLFGMIFWLVVVIGEVERIKYWYYNERLLCVGDGDQCVIGTVVTRPGDATDGDRKLNLLLAPFIRDDCIVTLVAHLNANADLLNQPNNFRPPFHNEMPVYPPAELNVDDPLSSNLKNLKAYMSRLAGAEPPNSDGEDANIFHQILIGWVERLMSDDNKNFFNRFYRKDPAHIPENSDLWNAIPADYDDRDWSAPEISPSQLNPMFRFEYNNLVPFLHCELEGNRLALMLDAIIVALATWLVTLVALSVALVLAGALGVLIAIAVSFLAGVFLGGVKLVADGIFGEGGVAEEPDVDYDDLDESLDEDDKPERPGDLVVLYGRWIMDTEHSEYFEIHPVRAYYLVAQNDLNEPERVESNEEQENLGFENFDPRLVSKQMAEDICDMVHDREEEEPPDFVERTLSEVLSYGLATRYGGGGFA